MKNSKTKKRKVSLLLSVLIAIALLPVRAEKVESDKASQLAQQFVQSKRQVPAKDVVHLRYAATQNQLTSRSTPIQVNGQDTVFYYVFNIDENAGGGFVIIAADDAVTPVLGYSDNGSYDENNLPPNFAYWMDYLQQEIRHVIVQKLPQSEAIQEKWNDYLKGDIPVSGAVLPLLLTTWDQISPFSNLCPIFNSQRCYTGCVATAMAQIMKYHRHPAQGKGSKAAYSTETHHISVPAVNFAVSYDWNNMLNSYSGSATSAQQNAVATLMYHCGVSVEMDYSPDGSSTSPSNVAPALTTYFGYDKSIQLKLRSNYENADWEALMKAQLNAGLPIIYTGYNSSSGHTFVCDGYKDDNTFHFNWGWSGYYDGYFVSTVLNPGTGGSGSGSGTYNQDQNMIINIKPDAGGTAPYEMGLRDVFSTSKTTVAHNETFSVSAQLRNWGSGDFPGGDVGAALVNNAGQTVEVIGTTTVGPLQSNHYFTSPHTINCKVSNSVPAGQYKLRAVIRRSGGSWEILTESTNCASSINIQVTEGGGSTDDYNMILYEVFEASKSSVSRNEIFSVSAQLNNSGTGDFPGGNVGVALVNNAGQTVEIIGTTPVGALPSNYHFTSPHTISCSVSNSVTAGQYKLRAVIRSTGGSWEIINETIRCDNSINIQVTGGGGGDLSWNLTSTMKATLINGVLTISTSKNAEDMPDYPEDYPPWDDYDIQVRSVVIEEKVTSVGVWAFAFLTNLIDVTVPETVTKMGIYAFFGCESLKSFTVAWETPLNVPGNIFESGYGYDAPKLSLATLYVPTGTYSRYRTANVWKEFGTTLEYNPTGAENINVPDLRVLASNGTLHISGLQPGKPLYIFNFAGQLIYNDIAKAAEEHIPVDASGFYIVKTDEQTVKTFLSMGK